MPRTRTMAELVDDSYLRADLVGATDRHPRVSVLRYANQGCAELYDLLVEARGRAYYRATPSTIVTTAATSRYALPPSFYRLISIRVGGAGGYTLEPFSPQDEPILREPGQSAAKPTHYEIQPGYVELLPLHSAGVSVVVDYVPVFTDLLDTSPRARCIRRTTRPARSRSRRRPCATWQRASASSRRSVTPSARSE